MFWARLELVERRRWLTDAEYVELLALGQLLPGPNVINLAALVGYRYKRLPGFAAAMVGFIGWPFLIVIGMGTLYQRYGDLPLVKPAMAGMSAVAAGLLIASGVKMAAVMPKHWRGWFFAIAAFVSVSIMHWSLIAVTAVLAPCAIVLAWKEQA